MSFPRKLTRKSRTEDSGRGFGGNVSPTVSIFPSALPAGVTPPLSTIWSDRDRTDGNEERLADDQNQLPVSVSPHITPSTARESRRIASPTRKNTSAWSEQEFDGFSSRPGTSSRASSAISPSTFRSAASSFRNANSVPNAATSPRHVPLRQNSAAETIRRESSTFDQRRCSVTPPMKEKTSKRISSLFSFHKRKSSYDPQSLPTARPPTSPPSNHPPLDPDEDDPDLKLAIWNSIVDQFHDKSLNEALSSSRQRHRASRSNEETGAEQFDRDTRLAIIASLEENPDLLTSSLSNTYQQGLPNIYEENDRDLYSSREYERRRSSEDAPIRLVYPPTPELKAQIEPEVHELDDDDEDIYGEQVDMDLYRRV